MRVQADEGLRGGGRGDACGREENITFIMGMRSSRRNTATVRFARVRVTSLRNLEVIQLNLSMNSSSPELTGGQCLEYPTHFVRALLSVALRPVQLCRAVTSNLRIAS